MRPNKPIDTPRVLRSHGFWLFSGLSIYVLVMTILIPVSRILGMLSMGILALVSVAGVAAGVGMLVRRYGRDIRRARALGGRLCPSCLYDLSQLPWADACPECGESYEIAHVVAMWRKADQSYQARKRYTLAGDETPND